MSSYLPPRPPEPKPSYLQYKLIAGSREKIERQINELCREGWTVSDHMGMTHVVVPGLNEYAVGMFRRRFYAGD